MERYEFSLSISPEQFEEYYRGTARQVVARCRSGQTVQFPASLLQRFVTREGIHGNFVLTCDGNHRCVGLERADASGAFGGG